MAAPPTRSQQTGGAPQNPAPDPSADPSMEDILASIRRILNEDEAPKPAPEPQHSEPPANADKGILVLDSSMMVENAPPESAQPKARPEPPAAPAPSVENPPLPDLKPSAPQAAAFPETPVGPDGSSLVAPAAAAAAGTSVGALVRALASERNAAVQRGGPTIEDLVRAELRPMLKQWLDQYLPPLVERLVQAEIERVVSRTEI